MATILVVDDYIDAAESTAKWLTLLGHEVEIARDGYQALEIARRQRPSYVLLDLGLPRLDGYEVAKMLRQELPCPLVIIAVTGYGREEDRRRALAAGCDHYLLKPVDPRLLIGLLSGTNIGPDSTTQEAPAPEATGP